MSGMKIVATIGPTSADAAILRAMIDAGMNVARIGLAHGTLDDHLLTYETIRDTAAEMGADLAILAEQRPGPIADLDLCSRGSYEDGPSAAPPKPLKRSPCPNFYIPRFRHVLTSVRSDRPGHSVSVTHLAKAFRRSPVTLLIERDGARHSITMSFEGD